jgi:acyl carrier protein
MTEPLRTAEPDAATQDMRDDIIAAPPGDRMDLLRDFVRQRVVRVLRRDAADPPGWDDRLTDLGLDSLMAVQLRGLLGAGLGFGATLPATLMFDYPTIEKLAAYLLQHVCPDEDPAADPQDAATMPAPLGATAVAAMTDADIEALLSRRLARTPLRDQTDVITSTV